MLFMFADRLEYPTIHALGKQKGIRRYCKGCYRKKITGLITKNRVPKVATYCMDCEGQPYYCLNCFVYIHGHTPSVINTSK